MIKLKDDQVKLRLICRDTQRVLVVIEKIICLCDYQNIFGTFKRKQRFKDTATG